MEVPAPDDVVVRQQRQDESTVYLLGTLSAPDQVMQRTRDEAVSHACAYAKHQHVRAWFAKGNDDFVLLGTFRKEPGKSVRSSDGEITKDPRVDCQGR